MALSGPSGGHKRGSKRKLEDKNLFGRKNDERPQSSSELIRKIGPVSIRGT